MQFENKNIANAEFKKMLKYIIENPSKKLNLNTLAEAFDLNPNYCSSLFRRYFECGFSEFVTQIRILNAARIIKTTDERMEDIAFKCGYSDYGYFNKVFKKILGVTPNEFRKKNKSNSQ